MTLTYQMICIYIYIYSFRVQTKRIASNSDGNILLL